MKSIYEFEIKQKIKKQVEEQTEEGKLLKEVEQEIPIKIIFKKPSRSESEEADIVSAVEYSESIRKGILTKPLLARFYDEKGGFLSENFDTKYGKLLVQFFELENEYRRLTLKDDKTPEDEKRVAELATQFVQVQNDLQALEAQRNNLFQNTAETRAQNKTAFWLTLFLTYFQDPDKEPESFFKGETFEQKREDYDKKIESDDPFILRVIDKMSFFVILWFLGKASNKDDFKRIEDSLNPQVKIPQIEEKGDENETPSLEGKDKSEEKDQDASKAA